MRSEGPMHPPQLHPVNVKSVTPQSKRLHRNMVTRRLCSETKV